jgi:hypothetical protein
MPSVIMLSVVMLNVVMLNVVMPSVVMLSVVIPSVAMPSVVMPSVVMPSVIMPSVIASLYDQSGTFPLSKKCTTKVGKKLYHFQSEITYMQHHGNRWSFNIHKWRHDIHLNDIQLKDTQHDSI